MPTPLVKPVTVPEPFAVNGSKNTIPTASQIGVTPGKASLNDGFPPLTMTPIASGGVPPSGLDFNGILNLITQHTAWVNAGNQYTFDAALSTFTGGYSKGAILQSNDGASCYISLVDNNTVDFNSTPSSIGTQWAVYAGQAATAGQVTVATTGGNTTLSTQQYSARYIFVTGVLTADATLTFPAALGVWFVVNNTTGAFKLNVKAAGSAVNRIVRQGSGSRMYCDGTNVRFDVEDGVTATPGTSDKGLATNEFVTGAVAAVAATQTSVSQIYFMGQS